MAKPNTPPLAIASDPSEPYTMASPDESPGAKPVPKPQPIGPAPKPQAVATADEPLGGLPDMMKCIVSHGVLRRDGKVYEQNEVISLPKDVALELIGEGTVKAVRIVAR